MTFRARVFITVLAASGLAVLVATVLVAYFGRTGFEISMGLAVVFAWAVAIVLGRRRIQAITDLRKADQIRRDFVANVSHELRTPLTAIRGYVEALGDADPEESRRFLEVIVRHTNRMERLVRDLLRLAQIESGQETLERIPCSLTALFAAVETDLAATIAARGQRIVRAIEPGADRLLGDPAKVQDALRNLLENATNYSPRGSTITLGGIRRDDTVVITVADEGHGIPEGDLTRVFERFYRVEKSRAREGQDPGGTGLGLAIVKHLVELHGGTVRAENRREGGAVFTIQLPIDVPKV